VDIALGKTALSTGIGLQSVTRALAEIRVGNIGSKTSLSRWRAAGCNSCAESMWFAGALLVAGLVWFRL